jgi:hypothetical protein
MTAKGREEPLISEFLTTALESLLSKLSKLTQNPNIHTPDQAISR